MASSKNSWLLILLLITAVFIVPKIGLFSTFDDLTEFGNWYARQPYISKSFNTSSGVFDFKGTGNFAVAEGNGVRMSAGATDASQTGFFRYNLEGDWQFVELNVVSTFDLTAGSQMNCNGGSGIGVSLGLNTESFYSRSMSCKELYLDPPFIKESKTTLLLIKTPSGKIDAYSKPCETCVREYLKTVSASVDELIFSLSTSHSESGDRGGSAFGYFAITGVIVDNVSQLTILQSQIDILSANITFLQSSLEQKAETMKSLQLTITEYSDIIKALELRVADEAAVANQLELDLAGMVNLTNSLQLRLDEQLVYLNNLNLNLAEKEALVRQLRISNAEQEALLAQMRGSFAEQAAILNGLNLTLQDDAAQISGLELSLQAQGGIIDAMRLNLSEQQELISFLKLSNAEKLDLIKSLNLTIQEQQRLIDDLKLTPVLEVERLCENTGGVWSSSKGCTCQSGKVFVTGTGCKMITDAGGAPIFGGVNPKMLLYGVLAFGGLIILRKIF